MTGLPEGWSPDRPMSRLARFSAATYDSDSRTAEVVISTGARVRRWFGYEELAIGEGAVDLARVDLGQVRLLDHHDGSNRKSILGTLEMARIEGDALVGRVRFADTPEAREAEGQVARGELTGISAGYRITAFRLAGVEDDVEIWRAERWELLEVSLVSVPADPHAGVRSALPLSPPAHEGAEAGATTRKADMSEDVKPAAPAASHPPVDLAAASRAEQAGAARALEITRIAERAGLPAEVRDAAIEAGEAVDAFRARAFDHLAAASAASRVAPAPRAEIVSSHEDPAQRAAAMTDALVARALGRTPEGRATEYMDHGFAEMAAEILGVRGRLSVSKRDDVLHRAFHTTSDFPAIVENLANRVLLANYQAAAPTYRAWAQRETFTDFKPTSMVRPGDFPGLEKVGETGEIKAGTVSESKETVTLATYARQIRLSRNLIINDDLGALNRVISGITTRIAQDENAIAYALLAANPVLATDNTAVFHTANHKNLASTGTAITVDAVAAAKAAMRKQTSLDGLKLNISPRILVTGPDRELQAQQLTAVVQPQQAGSVNPFSGTLQVVTDAHIDGNSWYLFAEPSAAACFVYGFLDGAEGPKVRSEEPFGVLGLALQVVHDFAFGAIDYRGAYRNPGA